MKALVWSAEAEKGEEYDIVDIPATHVDAAREWRDRLFETIAEADDEMMELYLEGQEPDEKALVAAIRRATHRERAHAGAHRLGVQEQGRPADARRGGGVPALAARRRRDRRPPGRQARRGRVARARRGRAAGLARVQDRQRPAPRQAHVRPHLLRHDEGRLPGAQQHQGQQGADRQDLPDAREQARGDRARRRRPDRRRDGAQEHHHGRHAVRAGATRSSWSR